MAKKKSKKIETGVVKGFEVVGQAWSNTFQWHPMNTNFKIAAQLIYLGSWPVEVTPLSAETESNETLIVLLGPLESASVHKRLMKAVGHTRNVLFVGLPGFGMNMNVDLTHEDIRLKSFAEFMVPLLEMDELASHEIHMFGSSAAASVALETVLRLPKRVRSLSVSGLIHRPSKIWQLLLKEVSHRIDRDDYLDCTDAALLYLVSDDNFGRGRAWGIFRHYLRRKVEMLTPVQKGSLNKIINLILMGDGLNEDHLKKTPDCRVLAFTGEFDHFSSPYDHAHFADACINGIFATLDEADHLIHVERPRHVASLISYFLDEKNIDDIDGLRTYPPHSYVTLDRRRDPRYVTSRPMVKLETEQVVVPEDWEDPVPTSLVGKLRNINFSGCLIEIQDERFYIREHAQDLKIYLPKVDVWLKVLAFEQVNHSVRCLFFHENYEAAMAFKEMLEYGEHFVDADFELDDSDSIQREMPWLGAKRQGGGFY